MQARKMDLDDCQIALHLLLKSAYKTALPLHAQSCRRRTQKTGSQPGPMRTLNIREFGFKSTQRSLAVL
jgi:hypothetical protein